MKKYFVFVIGIWVIVSCKTTTKVDDVSKQNNIQTDSVFTYPLQQINSNIDSLLGHKYASLATVYEYSQHKSIWPNDSSILTAIHWLQGAPNHGIDTSKLNIKQLITLQKQLNIRHADYAFQRALLDIQLTNAVKTLGYKIRFSSLKPSDYYPSWNFETPKALADSNWVKLVLNDNIEKLDAFFSPKHKLYQKLKEQLAQINQQPDSAYQKIVNPGFSLRKGDSNQYVVPLRTRLLKNDSTHQMVFDDELHKAVVQFQKSHGLLADGIVGGQTYYFLNLSKKEQQNLILLNMTKLRWLSDYQLQSGLVVNIPSMQLELYHNDSLYFETEVIVGEYKNQTPTFHSKLDYVVFNPCWTVPNSIAKKSMLPRLQKDSMYLQNRNMFITQNGKEIDPKSIDFSQYSKNYFPFKIFQRTSSSNALGQVKFMFENSYSIYLHDTPGKSLFQKSNRALSHGCVRVNSATTMAKIILQDIDGQTTPHQYYFSKGYPIKVYLNKPISLNLVYFNYWINPDSKQLRYYNDIYNKDSKLKAAIAQDQN